MKPYVSPTAARAALVALMVVAIATATSAQTPPTFSVRGPSDIGEAGPRDAVPADVDGDGDLDLVVTTTGRQVPGGPIPHKVNVLTNDGSGVFVRQSSVNFAFATGLTAADFNHDGAVDFAVTQQTPGKPVDACGPSPAVAIYFGNATGTAWTLRTPCLIGGVSPLAVQAGDFNSDSHPDLAVISSSGGGLRIFINDGAGAFGPGRLVNSSTILAQDMAPAVDVTGDGILDLVVAYNAGFAVFVGNGDGTFNIGGNTTPGGNSLAIAVGDVTGDGNQDLVELQPDRVRIDRGLGNGSFEVGASPILIGPGLQDVALSDVNGDSKLDIVVAGGGLVGSVLFLNNGNGAFANSVIPRLGAVPSRVVAGDWNRDGNADVLGIDANPAANGQVFAALQNAPERIPPTVELTSPAEASTVRGVVTINANATDNTGVSRVEFFVNGQSIGSSNGPAFSATWDTSALNGAFTITARAFDAAGNTAEDTVSVIVADQVNPTVDITAPAAGSIVRGAAAISAVAADNVGVTRVDFFANETLIGSSTGPNYTINWDASALAGNFTIRARAVDAAGNFADDSVSVTVADIAPPSAPTNLTGRSIRNFHEVRLNWTAATDNAAVDHYRLYELVRVSSNQTEWQLVNARIAGTTTVAEIRGRRGHAHIFAVTAVDAAGNESARSESVSVSRDEDDNN